MAIPEQREPGVLKTDNSFSPMNVFTRDHVTQTKTINSHQRFLTHSSFEGSWDPEMKMMEGLGTYHYPDGSEYRGCFFLGRFHGYGRLLLAAPHKFTVKGYFEHGKLVRIDDMWFSDNLHIEGEFVDGKFNCQNWTYLTPDDRRYIGEMRYGHQPVGPTAYITSKLIPRKIPPHCYDTEEGFFMPKSGFIFDRPRPYKPSIYEGCQKEKDWIIRHCRKAITDEVTEPRGKDCRNIIINNLDAESDLLACSRDMQPSHFVDRKRYFYKLCKDRLAVKRKQQKDNERRKTTIRASKMPAGIVCKTDKKEPSVEACILEKNEEYEADDESDSQTSSKDDQQVCIGPLAYSSDEYDSFSGQTIKEDINVICVLADKFKDVTYSQGLSVVQSNLMRRSKTSYVDLQRGNFEL